MSKLEFRTILSISVLVLIILPITPRFLMPILVTPFLQSEFPTAIRVTEYSSSAKDVHSFLKFDYLQLNDNLICDRH